MSAVYSAHFAFGVFFKPVLTAFGWTSAMTSGAFSLAMITQGLLGIAMGGLCDRFGPRLVLSLCGSLTGLGFLLMSQISTVWQLYVFYGIIIGAGISGVMVALVSTVARWFVSRRGVITGIVMTGVGIGTLIGPPLASRLIATYFWRLSYAILGGMVLVVVVLAAQLLRRDPAQIGQMPYGENKGKEPRLELSTVGFSLKEAVHSMQFWVVCAVFFCSAFCRLTIIVHFVPYATELGVPAMTAANILAVIGALSIVGRVVLGIIADRIGNRQVFIIGFVLMSATLFWLIPAREVWMLYLFAVIFGFAFGMGVAESPIVAWLFGLRSHGLIFGIIALGFNIGGAVGPFLAGYIFDATDSYQLAFLVCGAVSIFGVILAALLRPTKVGRAHKSV